MGELNKLIIVNYSRNSEITMGILGRGETIFWG
jgi:hypothetical protein